MIQSIRGRIRASRGHGEANHVRNSWRWFEHLYEASIFLVMVHKGKAPLKAQAIRFRHNPDIHRVEIMAHPSKVWATVVPIVDKCIVAHLDTILPIRLLHFDQG